LAAVIQHVTFEIRREQAEECVAFYRLLGFEPAEPPPSLRDRAAWVGRGGTQIHLMWVDDPVTLPRGHVAVVPDDYDAALERLREEGHDPEPRREHWGAPRSYVHDPAGNLVELLESPPPGA
jgi:catechol 2,3-dioxygenase-like lactoylglutathione lyase family enzyme